MKLAERPPKHRKTDVKPANRTKNLEERLANIETELQTSYNDMTTKKSECSQHMFENRELKEEMAVINKVIKVFQDLYIICILDKIYIKAISIKPDDYLCSPYKTSFNKN